MRFLLFGFILIFSSGLSAQKGQWFSINETMELTERSSEYEVKQELLRLARNKAVQSAGTDVEVINTTGSTWGTGGSDDRFFESFQQLSSLSSRGLIIEEKKPTYKKLSEDEIQISYKAKVAVQKEDSDPFFKFDICKVNRKVFKVGDYLEMRVQTPKDAYLTIFSVQEDQKAGVVFPNTYMKEQKLTAFETRVIPNEQESQNLRFKIQASPQGYEEYSEVLIFVISKQPIPFQSLKEDIRYGSTWLDVNKWITKIPGDQRAMSYAHYLVKR